MSRYNNQPQLYSTRLFQDLKAQMEFNFIQNSNNIPQQLGGLNPLNLMLNQENLNLIS